jgi:hypothetical protein
MTLTITLAGTAAASVRVTAATGRNTGTRTEAWQTDPYFDCPIDRETDGELGLSDSASGAEAWRRRSQADTVAKAASRRLSRQADPDSGLEIPANEVTRMRVLCSTKIVKEESEYNGSSDATNY